jgi:hypothetical protein
MSETPFHRTRMGRDFYDKTLPRIAQELGRLNEHLARMSPAPQETPASPPAKPSTPDAVDELLLATYGLINAVQDIYGKEFDPESNLYRRMKAAEQAADAVR